MLVRDLAAAAIAARRRVPTYPGAAARASAALRPAGDAVSDQFLGLGSGLGILGRIDVPKRFAEALRGAALMVFAGMLALVVGYELPLAAMLLAPMPSIRVTWRRNPVPCTLLLMGCGLIAAVIEKSQHAEILEGILGAVSFVGLWAMGTLWLLQWRGLLPGWARAATWVMTGALMGLKVIQGALWRPVIDSALLLAIYIRGRWRICRGLRSHWRSRLSSPWPRPRSVFECCCLAINGEPPAPSEVRDLSPIAQACLRQPCRPGPRRNLAHADE